jgi:two-component system, NarL family, nitrate/nitrite response regulator NarL
MTVMEARCAPQHLSPSLGSPHSALRVIVVSEVRLLGEGLALALEREASLSVCGCFGVLNDALRNLAALQPDIVLLNTDLRAAADAITRLRALAPGVKVIALAITENLEDVVAWAQAGVAGYIPSTAALRDVAPLLVDIVRGEQPCAARVAAGLLRRVGDMGPSKGFAAVAVSAATPTAREMQVLEMISSGLSNKEIARRLNIGLATTKSHVHNLLGKLGLQRRGQAASWIRAQQASSDVGNRPPAAHL